MGRTTGLRSPTASRRCRKRPCEFHCDDAQGFLFARPLVSGSRSNWDLVPGAQVTLNARQHVRVAGGVRLPVNDADVRKKSVIVYLLWDWYEGGFLRGW